MVSSHKLCPPLNWHWCWKIGCTIEWCNLVQITYSSIHTYLLEDNPAIVCLNHTNKGVWQIALNIPQKQHSTLVIIFTEHHRSMCPSNDRILKRKSLSWSFVNPLGFCSLLSSLIRSSTLLIWISNMFLFCFASLKMCSQDQPPGKLSQAQLYHSKDAIKW